MHRSPMCATVPPDDCLAINRAIADRFDETGELLAGQDANPFRIAAYRRAAEVLRGLERPVEEVLSEEGTEGLDRLPGIGAGLAAAIRDYVETGRMPLQERLRAQRAPVDALRSVPGIGERLARRLQEELGLETLEELELAAHDGRLARLAGFGPRRLEGIRAALAQRLGRMGPPAERRPEHEPPVEELLDVDREYRELVAAHRLPKVAPRRMNPLHRAWLPILHARRGARRYTALFSKHAAGAPAGADPRLGGAVLGAGRGPWPAHHCDRDAGPAAEPPGGAGAGGGVHGPLPSAG
ncbi:MAG TPA: helix-hairpin-helix domain-containing protein, partial [Gemmatimonadales bacterium]|nr:helix-hairpin-helix domain-containing protein [Gemmatimonadales bacterium]